MSKNDRFVRSIVRRWNDQEVFIPLGTLIEIYDQKRVLIERHCGILDYGDHDISVKVSFGQVSVRGNDLKLRMLSKEKLVITGAIFGVHLSGELCT